jgi:[protein-PII] uridylyltransferase
VLTVADVNGTNPKLWNSWKATLFRDLYELTAQALRRGLERPIDRELLISESQDAARELLRESKTAAVDIERVWQFLTEDYFLRYRPSEIAWHTEVLADSDTESEYGLLDVRMQPEGDGIEAMLYTPRKKRIFAHATALLAELGMTIVDVRIVPLANGFSLDNYIFMELDKRTEIDEARLNKIRRILTRILASNDDSAASVTRPAPRQVRMFATKTVISFDQDIANGRTVMELVASDRPGLLSTVGQVFVDFDIDIETAKILTIGERAEDVFYIVDLEGQAIPDETCERLRASLIEHIDTNA